MSNGEDANRRGCYRQKETRESDPTEVVVAFRNATSQIRRVIFTRENLTCRKLADFITNSDSSSRGSRSKTDLRESQWWISIDPAE